MMILKCEIFMEEVDLANFVNNNNIARENIFTITRTSNVLENVKLVIFYYADSESKEKRPGFFG